MESSQPTPPVVIWWYRVYRIVMIAYYMAFVALGAWAYTQNIRPEENGAFLGLIIGSLGLFFGALFLLSFLVPRRAIAWNIHLVLLVLGLAGGLSTPLSAVLLHGWLRPEVRSYYRS